MKNQILLKSSFWGKMTVMVIVLLFSATFSNAQGTTFAQFQQRLVNEQTLRDFLFDNNTNDGTFRTVGTGSPILFQYQNVGGLPAELSGPQEAHIFITCPTNVPATQPFGTTRLVQPINQTCTIQILRDTATSAGTGGGSRTNLLTAIITPAATSPTLAGENGADSGAFTASTPNQNIMYTSDFLFFGGDGAGSRNLSIALSAITPGLFLGPNNFLASFSANAAGTFAASTLPSYFPPTAAGSIISGRVLSRKGTGVRNAKVTLTTATGETLTAYTNNFGHFRFFDVMAGQTVVLSVKSKQYSYEAQTLTLSEDAVGFNFVPR